MGLGELLGGKVLGKILRYSPQILEAAQQLYKGYRRGGELAATGSADAEARLQALELHGIEQSELLAKLAEQVRDLSVAVENSQRRLRAVLAVAVIAALLSLVSLLFLLSR